jgi:hypothetical protein
VNEKTFDFVMAGVSSVVGGYNRYSIMEAVVNFDTNYVKKWLVSNVTTLGGFSPFWRKLLQAFSK